MWQTELGAGCEQAVVTEAEVDQDAFKVEWWRPAFTRRREIFMARTAMAGFLSLQVGEVGLLLLTVPNKPIIPC
jgi:hypothetical protein